MRKNVHVELWDWDFIGSNDRIATFRFNFHKLLEGDGHEGPKWVNLYGPNPYATENMIEGNNYADYMTKHTEKGSHYRGRLLFAATLTP